MRKLKSNPEGGNKEEIIFAHSPGDRLNEQKEKNPVKEFQAQIRKLRPKHQQLMNNAGTIEERDDVLALIKKDFSDTPPPVDLPDLTYTSPDYVSYTKLEGETVKPEDYNLKITKISDVYTADLNKHEKT